MGQPATHHGIEIGSGGPGCRQFAQDPLPLVLGHIDQKTVGCIDGETGRKLIQQIDPCSPEQAKEHQCQRKARQLKQAAAALARQVGQRQPQGMRPAHSRSQPQHQRRQQGQQPHQQAHATHQTQRQPYIGGKAPDQRKQPEQADRQGQPGGNPRLQLPAQYPQRRHLQQPQEGHKSEQQGDKERYRHPQRKGAPGGGWQIRRQQVPQQLQGDPLHDGARYQTQQRTDQRQRQQQGSHQLPERATGCPQGLEQRHHIGLALGKVAHSNPHRQRPQQHPT